MTYEFLFGKVPFGDEEDDPYAVYEKVQDRDLEYPRWADKQEKSKEIINQLLSKNPAKRLGGSFDNIKSHPWFSGFDWDKLLSKLNQAPFIPKSKDMMNEIHRALAHKKNFNETIAKIEEKSKIPPPRQPGAHIQVNWDHDF